MTGAAGPQPRRRSLFFYSAWPLGYHNPEAERKALAFAAAGWDTVYVAGIGIRNPRVTSARKLVDRSARKLAPGRFRPPTAPASLRTASVLVAPPRQHVPVRRFNRRWLEQQLRGVVDWRRTVAWLRWPTPELVDVLPALGPAAIVYEAVDAYDASPGIEGRWVAIHEAAERRLAELADAVVVPSEWLAARFRAMGADVRVIPHGVDLDLFRYAPPARSRDDPATVGFVGTLDYKLDIPVLRGLAEARPDRRLRLIGPAQEGFRPSDLGGLANVSVEPAIPYDRVGPTIASFDVGILPYIDYPGYAASDPLKNLELMAVGRPAVARHAASLEPYRGLLYFAHDAATFVAAVDRALADDSPELAARRRAIAEANGWQARLEQLIALAAALSG